MKKLWKKISGIIKECPYLSTVIILFAIIAVVILGKNMIQGKMNMEYVKKHVSEPIWTEAFNENTDDETEEYEDTSKEEDEILQNEIADVQEVKSETENKNNEQKNSSENQKDKVSDKSNKKEKNSTPEETKEQKNSSKENVAGVTKFQKYKAMKIDSPYYTDRGKTALTTEYKYKKVDDNYFSDAAFIGDSRTLGLYDFSGWKKKADFYCETGFSLYEWTKGATVTLQNTGKKVDLKSALEKKQYGKIYLMIGMNDLGYGNSEKYAEWLSEMIEMIKETQPTAIIYLMGNLHLSKNANNMKTTYNNINVNDKNVSMALLADGITTFYLDCNSVFTDKNGYLKADLTSDGCHLYGYCYEDWANFIKEHAVVK